jgi:hypothetical protein
VLSLQHGVENDDVLRRYETVTTLYVRTQFIAGPPSGLPTNRPVLRNKRALPYEAIGPRSSHTLFVPIVTRPCVCVGDSAKSV